MRNGVGMKQLSEENKGKEREEEDREGWWNWHKEREKSKEIREERKWFGKKGKKLFKQKTARNELN